MGGALKSIGNVVKDVLKSPILSMAASFIPVVGPFIAMASKIYNAYNAAKSGDLLGAAGSFLGGGGGGGIGSALGSTVSDVMGKASSWIGSSGMNFATTALKAVGGNSGDVLKFAQIAGQVMGGSSPDVAALVRNNAIKLAQRSQSLQYA